MKTAARNLDAFGNSCREIINYGYDFQKKFMEKFFYRGMLSLQPIEIKDKVYVIKTNLHEVYIVLSHNSKINKEELSFIKNNFIKRTVTAETFWEISLDSNDKLYTCNWLKIEEFINFETKDIKIDIKNIIDNETLVNL